MVGGEAVLVGLANPKNRRGAGLSMDPSMKIARCGDWMSARINFELVMMSAEKGLYLGLSEVGARVWDLLETESDLDRVCAALELEFDVAPDVCRAEVETFVGQMAEQGLVTIEAA